MEQTFTHYIFLVDDDEDDHFLIQLVFNRYSPEFIVKALHNGEELLRTLEQATVLPTLILLDINMPRMGGFEALKLIRQASKYDSVPVIMLTTSDQTVDKQRALELKANGFITKPNSIEQLNQLALELRRDWLMGTCRLPLRESQSTIRLASKAGEQPL